jgi:hypothetical protein
LTVAHVALVLYNAMQHAVYSIGLAPVKFERSSAKRRQEQLSFVLGVLSAG